MLIFAIIVTLACTAILVFLRVRRRSRKSPIPPLPPRPPVRVAGSPEPSPLEPPASAAPPLLDAAPPLLDAVDAAPLEPSAPAARPPRPQKVSITHPKLLSKGYASLFIMQIYLPEMRYQAAKNIEHRERVWDPKSSRAYVGYPTGDRIEGQNKIVQSCSLVFRSCHQANQEWGNCSAFYSNTQR